MLGTFIQTYGYWILMGVAFIFMMRMHGGGMHKHGTGGSGTSPDAHTTHTTNARELGAVSEKQCTPDAPQTTGNETERQPR